MESEKLNSSTVPDGATSSSMTNTDENGVSTQRSFNDLLLDKKSNISHNSHKPSRCRVNIPSDCLEKLQKKDASQESALFQIEAEMKTTIQVFMGKKDVQKAYLLIKGNDMESVIKTKQGIVQKLTENTPKLYVPLGLHETLANADSCKVLREVSGAEVTPIDMDENGRSIIYHVKGNYKSSITQQMKSISIATTVLKNMINVYKCQENYDPSDAPIMPNEEPAQSQSQNLKDIVYIEEALSDNDSDRHEQQQINDIGLVDWNDEEQDSVSSVEDWSDWSEDEDEDMWM